MFSYNYTLNFRTKGRFTVLKKKTNQFYIFRIYSRNLLIIFLSLLCALIMEDIFQGAMTNTTILSRRFGMVFVDLRKEMKQRKKELQQRQNQSANTEVYYHNSKSS